MSKTIHTHTSTRVSFVGRRLSNFQPTTTEKRPVVGTIETAATSVRPMFIDCLAALAQSEVDWIGFDVLRMLGCLGVAINDEEVD